MFTVIRCENKRNGLKKLFVRRKYYIDTVNEGNLHFLILTLNDSQKIDWNQVEQLLSGKTESVLLQKGLTLPAYSALTPPDLKQFRRLLAKNAVEEILKKAAKEQKENHVLFIDTDMNFLNWAQMLFSNCDFLTIAANNPAEYAKEIASDNDGCESELTELARITELNRYTLIVAPVLNAESAKYLAKHSVPCPIISAEVKSNATVGGTLMTNFMPEIPEAYLEEIPEGIEKAEFMAAVYGCAGPTADRFLKAKRCDIYVNGMLVVKQVTFE